MKRLKATVAFVITLLAGIASGGCSYKKQEGYVDCKQLDDAFSRRVDDIKRDAHVQLKVGTRRAEVTHFFDVRGIPFTISGSEASGTLYVKVGCMPQGCGTDRALIGVRVALDGAGSVAADPVVVGMYTDCP